VSREFAIAGNGLVSRGVLVATINVIVALIVGLPAVKPHDNKKNTFIVIHATHPKPRSCEKIREGEPPG
jgi:energy-converting hydrogenase Eha subunit A